MARWPSQRSASTRRSAATRRRACAWPWWPAANRRAPTSTAWRERRRHQRAALHAAHRAHTPDPRAPGLARAPAGGRRHLRRPAGAGPAAPGPACGAAGAGAPGHARAAGVRLPAAGRLRGRLGKRDWRYTTAPIETVSVEALLAPDAARHRPSASLSDPQGERRPGPAGTPRTREPPMRPAS